MSRPIERAAGTALKIEVLRSGDVCSTHLCESRARIGRDATCEVRVEDDLASRVHAAVQWSGTSWKLEDLGSTNGLYHEGRRIRSLELLAPMQVQIGRSGTTLRFSFLTGETRLGRLMTTERRRHRARLVRLALLGSVVIVGFVAYAWHLHGENLRMAREVFYLMKGAELEAVEAQSEPDRQAATRRQQAYEDQYARMVRSLEADGSARPREEQLIRRVVQLFGEYDAEIPGDFVEEVKRRIPFWLERHRFQNAVRRAQQRGDIAFITASLRQQGLPPQLVYIALQESGFDPRAVGPDTRFGRAKGMWQLLAGTASDYGLRIGPLRDQDRFDPEDQRHDVFASTRAAVEHLRWLYRTRAQASGLLVLAAYNWGHARVDARVAGLDRIFLAAEPARPDRRNFWNLLSRYRRSVPEETYNYVFMIVAAAAIGEEPARFGVRLEEPVISP